LIKIISTRKYLVDMILINHFRSGVSADLISCKPFLIAIGCVKDYFNSNFVQQIQNNSLPNCTVPWLISLLGIDYLKEQVICSPDDDTVLFKHFFNLITLITGKKILETDIFRY
jgi:hypothetical protein